MAAYATNQSDSRFVWALAVSARAPKAGRTYAANARQSPEPLPFFLGQGLGTRQHVLLMKAWSLTIKADYVTKGYGHALLPAAYIVANLIRNRCGTDELTCTKCVQKFLGLAHCLVLPHPLFRQNPRPMQKIHLPRTLNLKIHGQ